MDRDNTLQIWKYELKVQDEVTIKMPRNSTVLSVQVQRGVPCIWALVRTNEEKVDRTFFVVGTGHPFPIAFTDFIGTFQLAKGELVFHLFAKTGGLGD